MMRWRMFGKVKENSYQVAEVVNGCTHLITLLLQICRNSAQQIKDLLDISERINSDNRAHIIDYLERNKEHIVCSDYEQICSHLRYILSRHRSYADTDWALPEEELVKYEPLYLFFEPLDIVEKYRWMFEDYCVDTLELAKEEDDKREELQRELREKAVAEIYDKQGVKAVIGMGKNVRLPDLLGEALGAVLPEKKVKMFVTLPEADGLDEVFYRAFWRRLMRGKEADYILELGRN